MRLIETEVYQLTQLRHKHVNVRRNKPRNLPSVTMKRIFFILTLGSLLTSCTNSQTNKNFTQVTGDIKTDIKSLISDGNHQADIMDGVSQNSRQAALTKKFQNGIRNNYDWFVEYMKTVPQGEQMPYNSKLGLTKEEYTELTSYLNNVELVSSGKENITAELKNDTVHFKSEGKLSDYDSLKIDLKYNTVIFRQYILPFSDTTNVTTDKNGLRSKWKGYSWRYEEPKNLDLDDIKDISKVKMKQYKFTIGRLEKNGKTYMSLKGREVEDGAKTVDFELPVVF